MLVMLPLLVVPLSALVATAAGAEPKPKMDSGHESGGAYGEWVNDTLGLPAFRYTFDQIAHSSRNFTPSTEAPWEHVYWGELPLSNAPTIRTHSEHIFQLGNDRLVVLASNFGAVRVRQDEGGPKLLNDASAAFPDGVDVAQDGGDWRLAQATQFGGGFGYLLDTQNRPLLTTYFTGEEGANLTGCSERTFGIGFANMDTVTDDFAVEHTLAVPPGDDPVVLVEVHLSNNGNRTRTVKWAEVWSSFMIHLDLKELRNTDRRTFSARHYRSSFEKVGLSGARHSRQYQPLGAKELDIANAYLEDVQLPERASLFDEDPPSPFLIMLNTTPGLTMSSTLGNDALAFFGRGGPRSADRKRVVWNNSVSELDAALIVTAELTLGVGQSSCLHYVWGYTADRNEGGGAANALAHAYSGAFVGGLARNVGARWRPSLTKFEMPSQPWMAREMAWHSYYVQGGITFDSFFNESIIDQGTGYRYGWGFQGAARDPVQHALPLIELRPEIAKSVIRYTLKELSPPDHAMKSDSGHVINLPYGIVAKGVIFPMGYAKGHGIAPDDMELYLLLLASEYLLATKDCEFARERISFFNSTRTHTVLEALQLCLSFVIDVVGVGEHGLMRELTSDWDDNLHPAPASYNVSESVLAAATASFVLDRVAAAFSLVGDAVNGSRAAAFAKLNRDSILESAWNGEWLRRSWNGNDGWLGDLPGHAVDELPGLFTAQHGWAFLGGVFDNDRQSLATVLHNIEKQCRRNFVFGFPYFCNVSAAFNQPMPDGVPLPPRTSLTNSAPSSAPLVPAGGPTAAMWFAVNHPTVLGLIAVNETEEAFREFVRNSMDFQARVAPNVWPGIWTSADLMHNDGAPGGWQRNAMPALCMHRHAWPLVSLRHLAGIHYEADGLRIRPAFPPRLGAYSLDTGLASVEYDGEGTFVCTYRPSVAGRCRVTVDLSLVATGAAAVARVEVEADGRVVATQSGAGTLVAWSNVVAATTRVVITMQKTDESGAR